MQTVKNILIIIALGLLVWILDDALNIPGKVAQIITPTQETPTAPDTVPLVVIPPTLAPEPTPVPQVLIIIPNPPNPNEVMEATAAAVAATEPPALPVEAVFVLTDGRWVDDGNAQFLADCAYYAAKGQADERCPANAAALLGVGR